jgi:hypothetical protein
MLERETSYRDADDHGEQVEGGYAQATRSTEMVEDDSVLVFDFLKRKRALPSARRLDFML